MLHLLTLLLCIPVLLVQAQCGLQHSYDAQIEVADGWNMTLVMTGLSRPRGMVIDNDGRLLVVDVGVGVKRFEVIEHENAGVCLSGSGEVILENEDVRIHLPLYHV